ncbi:hypothetical protein Pcinc_029288 [Petrolisthes cinctipes]|uniref:Uncharacterized protein n=1 Tax=Petrolisthes cinctipes TaxID=88211 RepID=A0AAE1F1U8_PETCI|nr:hypothetical protein Pcinc_029288 [Petrolisthes cinctipes]
MQIFAMSLRKNIAGNIAAVALAESVSCASFHPFLHLFCYTNFRELSLSDFVQCTIVMVMMVAVIVVLVVVVVIVVLVVVVIVVVLVVVVIVVLVVVVIVVLVMVVVEYGAFYCSDVLMVMEV